MVLETNIVQIQNWAKQENATIVIQRDVTKEDFTFAKLVKTLPSGSICVIVTRVVRKLVDVC